MPDLALGSDRPYSLVTTVVHRGPAAGHCRTQLDIHVGSGDLRLRFLDRDALARFCNALTDLAEEACLPNPRSYRPVLTRVYSDQDAASPTQQSFLGRLFP